MEHISDLKSFLSVLFKNSEEGVVGLINVPNGYSIINNAQFDQIFSEHINYFTPMSILKLMKFIGFEILELNIDSNSNKIDLYVVKPKKMLGPVFNSFNLKRQYHKEKLRNQLSNSKVYGIWGAGQKTISFSTLLPNDLNIIHFFDSDASKEGYLMPGIDIPIELPTQHKIQACDGIIIFAVSYLNEIKNLLIQNYGFNGEILAVDT